MGGGGGAIESALTRTIAAKKVTYDFARLMGGATKVSTSGFADHALSAERWAHEQKAPPGAALSQQAPRGGRRRRSSGGVLLLWNLGYLRSSGRLWPVPVILVGLVFLYMAWPRGQLGPVDHPRHGLHPRRASSSCS